MSRFNEPKWLAWLHVWWAGKRFLGTLGCAIFGCRYEEMTGLKWPDYRMCRGCGSLQNLTLKRNSE